MPIYEKRYKKNGEEYLKKVDEINIEEDLEEKGLEVSRIKEIYNNQERLKENQLVEEYTEETKLKELELMQNYKEIDTYEFLNKSMEIQHLYNRMPEEIRKKYKDISKFTKEYLPKFTKEVGKNIEELNKKRIEANKEETINKTNEELQKQINELQKQLKGEKAENV
jgi:gas vesicle protein